MPSYFKVMLEASKKVSDDYIEEFFGFNSTPKPIAQPQFPRPIQQPMISNPIYSPPPPQPMYHPIPSPMPTPMSIGYPYYNSGIPKKQSDSKKDDDGGFLKMLLAAGLLGGSGLAAHSVISSKLANHRRKTKLKNTINNVGEVAKQLPGLFDQFRNSEFGSQFFVQNQPKPVSDWDKTKSQNQRNAEAKANLEPHKSTIDAYSNLPGGSTIARFGQWLGNGLTDSDVAKIDKNMQARQQNSAKNISKRGKK